MAKQQDRLYEVTAMANTLTRFEKREKRSDIIDKLVALENTYCKSCPILQKQNDECLKCPHQESFENLGKELVVVSSHNRQIESQVKHEKKRFDAEISAYIELKKDFYSEYQIAEKWGIKETTLQTWRKRNGLEGKKWHQYI